MMYKFLRSIFFLFDAEKVHYFTMRSLRLLLWIPGFKLVWRSFFCIKNEKLGVDLFGLHFENPVGLAAGFDKDADFYNQLAQCGFGFIEIGTITPKPQSGNEKPRLFRLKKDEAIINRMGFNNIGIEGALENLKNRNSKLIIGGNIGKNKTTPNEEAFSDYAQCFEGLFDVVDYFVVNVSSPNTPNLRELQDKEPLTMILSGLMDINRKKPAIKPILLKIAPDLSDDQLLDIIDIVKDSGIHGVIATNTTISRANLNSQSERIQSIGAGGLSGKPLTQRSTEVIRFLHEKSNGSFPIIGVGGIHSANDAIEKINAGAKLVQVYTGFIYEGPALIKRINKAILSQKINVWTS
jgi:dihydroorotate dehydrogenase